ncbi:MAG TPA: hypothetical protein VGG98_09340 [Solirubrobacteraceae bacterium]|jgi:hypothetical protein
MTSHAGMLRRAGRAAIAFACVAMAGCGAAAGVGSTAHAGDAPTSSDATTPLPPAGSGACAPVVLNTLGRVAVRVYREGVASERTGSALHLATTSASLREAVEHDDPAATRAVARTLIATGHLTSLRVLRGARILTDVGSPDALAPLHGTILDIRGAPVGSFVASVWADAGFLAELDGVTEGAASLRTRDATVAGTSPLPSGTLPTSGMLTQHGVDYRYTSFPVAAYPAARPLRVYLLRSISSISALCARAPEDTLVNTLSRIATLIYAGETGRRTLPQVRRVQRDSALLLAVAHRDPVTTRAAAARLLQQHIVRLRIRTPTRLLADVGGPLVLAPVRAPLRRAGRTIGSFVLSIQDDEGYRRLVHRLAGLEVLMHAGSRLVKSSLGSSAPPAPAKGFYRYRGRVFRVFTLEASAFPSGPLRISVLIPIPYR